MKYTFHAILAAAAAVLAAPGAVASPLQLQTQAHKEQAVAGPQGQPQTRLVSAATVVPGDEIVYTITFRNVSEENAGGIVITDPVPAEMSYVAGSAFGPGPRRDDRDRGGRQRTPRTRGRIHTHSMATAQRAGAR